MGARERREAAEVRKAVRYAITGCIESIAQTFRWPYGRCQLRLLFRETP